MPDNIYQDLSTNHRALRRLQSACERAKRTLSSASQATIEIPCLFEDIDFFASITRTHFEGLCEDLFRRSLEPIEKVLRDSKVDKSDVHEIILVGGSTRIPRIGKFISDFFNGKEPNRSMNPDEAIAYGAAIQAAILCGDTSEKTKDILLLDVIPWSLGIQITGGALTPLVRRNTTIPLQKSQTVLIDSDNQSSVFVQIYEGEHVLAKDNNFLGEIELSGVLPGHVGVSQIEVRVDIDANGFSNASCWDKSTGRNRSTILSGQDRLSKEEIERMMNEATKFKGAIFPL